jgi:PAS domain S-box-containing protein
MVCLLPVWAFAAFLVIHSAQTDRTTLERNGRDLARGLAADVDRELAGMRATLHALSTSPYLRTGDFAAFHRQAAELSALEGSIIVLSEPEGQQLINTRLDYGEPLPKRTASESFARAIETGTVQVSNVLIGAVAKRPLVTVDVPVLRDGRVAYVLNMSIEPAAWDGILRQPTLPPDWVVSILDRRGIFVARSINAEMLVGQPARPEFAAAVSRAPEGWFSLVTRDGLPLYHAFRRSELSGWTLAVGMPQSAVEAPLKRSLLLLGTGGALSLLLTLVLAAVMSARIARPLSSLSRAAVALGHSEMPEPPLTGVREVNVVGRALVQAAERLQERQRERDRAFRLLVEAVRDYAIIMLDPEGRIVSWNPGAERIKGYRAEEILGRHFSTFYPSEDVAAGRPERELQIATREGRYEEEGRRVRRDGSEFIAHVVLTAVYDETGHLHGFGKVTRDISERKRAEEALHALNVSLQERTRELEAADRKLRALNENLEATVAARTADLIEANEEIQRFAYIVSHDLRAPLVNIMGFTAELETVRTAMTTRRAAAPSGAGQPPADGELDAEFAEALAFIKTSCAKMDRLIGAILKLSREGRRAFAPEPLDMNRLVGSIAASLAHQCEERGAVIEVEPLPDIVADRLAVEQILSNLVENAVKYMADGRPGRVEVSGREQPPGFVAYEVRDNGRGIDPKDRERIFELFRRAGVQDRPGEGIGLAHVRALVRRLGGSISYESQLGRGSIFRVILPKTPIELRKEEAA